MDWATIAACFARLAFKDNEQYHNEYGIIGAKLVNGLSESGKRVNKVESYTKGILFGDFQAARILLEEALNSPEFTMDEPHQLNIENLWLKDLRTYVRSIPEVQETIRIIDFPFEEAAWIITYADNYGFSHRSANEIYGHRASEVEHDFALHMSPGFSNFFESLSPYYDYTKYYRDPG